MNDSEGLAMFGTVCAIGALIIFIICFIKEKKITGMYKVAGIYGRIYAYLAVDLLMGGLVGLFAPLFVRDVSMNVLVSGICLAAGVGMYYNVYRKSPDFLKKRCLIDLTISGLGTAMRVTLFFLMFIFHAWWSVSKPETYRLERSGQEVYIFPDGRVYDATANRYGKANSNRTEVVWDD